MKYYWSCKYYKFITNSGCIIFHPWQTSPIVRKQIQFHRINCWLKISPSNLKLNNSSSMFATRYDRVFSLRLNKLYFRSARTFNNLGLFSLSKIVMLYLNGRMMSRNERVLETYSRRNACVKSFHRIQHQPFQKGVNSCKDSIHDHFKVTI